MGCSVLKLQKEVKNQQKSLEMNLQRQIEELIQNQQQQLQVTLGDHEELSIYDKSLEKQVKVPKLRQPIYNTIVQRRRIQKYDDTVK